ncbi:MAG: hypothetical protein GX062_01895 [Firmicutes bacterium]|jgi:hypothetical protein|nr:hypothetical protein [Bacillota bacterium]
MANANFSPAIINLLGLRVTVVDRSSTLSLGPLQQTEFFVSTKRNMSAEINGDLSSDFIPRFIILDSDFADANANSIEVAVGN